MVTITIKDSPIEILKQIMDKEITLRPVVQEQMRVMAKRIHEDGIATDGSAIGSYSSGYLKTREAKGRKEGSKVVISLTRQLENDYALIATTEGYGIGFNNAANADKSRWVENTYNKQIFEPTEDEETEINKHINEIVDKLTK